MFQLLCYNERNQTIAVPGRSISPSGTWGGNLMRLVAVGLLLPLWLYLLLRLARAGLTAWRFLLGCAGIFCFLALFVCPPLTDAYISAVCALARLVGGRVFSFYDQYGILLVPVESGSLILPVDSVCYGLIGIAGYLSLLSFYGVYSLLERCVLAVVGGVCVWAADCVQLLLSVELTRLLGAGVYELGRGIIGRVVFVLLNAALYYYVFTKGQVARMKIGGFSYYHT